MQDENEDEIDVSDITVTQVSSPVIFRFWQGIHGTDTMVCPPDLSRREADSEVRRLTFGWWVPLAQAEFESW